MRSLLPSCTSLGALLVRRSQTSTIPRTDTTSPPFPRRLAPSDTLSVVTLTYSFSGNPLISSVCLLDAWFVRCEASHHNLKIAIFTLLFSSHDSPLYRNVTLYLIWTLCLIGTRYIIIRHAQNLLFLFSLRFSICGVPNDTILYPSEPLYHTNISLILCNDFPWLGNARQPLHMNQCLCPINY